MTTIILAIINHNFYLFLLLLIIYQINLRTVFINLQNER